MAKLNYVELRATDVAASKAFYENMFGFAFTDFGPAYVAVEGENGLGLSGMDDALSAPLPAIEVDDLDTIFAKMKAMGTRITVDIFNFPGGRRFQFLDPSGNELAAFQND